VQQGDLFMLCSDGFWELVDPEEVRAAAANNNLEAAGERLVRLARERGGEGGDNITVAMAQLGKAQRKFRLFS
jgi:serine/threonine protein phosphatase PrpC